MMSIERQRRAVRQARWERRHAFIVARRGNADYLDHLPLRETINHAFDSVRSTFDGLEEIMRDPLLNTLDAIDNA